MAKIALQANCLTLTTEMKLAAIKECEAYAPEALCIRDEDGNKVFSVGTAAADSISPYGICFASATVVDGYACMSEAVPAGSTMDEVVENALVTFDKHMENLAVIEKQVNAKVAEIAARRAAIKAEFNPAPVQAPAQE